MKILLIGPYPPPYGGISVQIARIQKHLSGSADCRVINIGERRKEDIAGAISAGYLDFIAKLVWFSLKGYTLHMITNGHNFKSWLSAFCCSAAGLLNRRKTIIAVGSGMIPQYIDKAGFVETLLIKLTLRLAGAVICRNESSRERICSIGVPLENVYIVSGYLGIDPSLIGQLPDDIARFIESHKPIIGAHTITDPEYGLPLVLESFKRIKQKRPNSGLILIGMNGIKNNICNINNNSRHANPSCDNLAAVDNNNSRHANPSCDNLAAVCNNNSRHANPSCDNSAAVDNNNSQHANPGCDNPDIFYTGSVEHSTALAVMKSLDVFVRATYFDGDSNSVREALALGRQVVASDTDFRPQGVIKFKKGDLEDLVNVLDIALTKSAEFDNKTDTKTDTVKKSTCDGKGDCSVCSCGKNRKESDSGLLNLKITDLSESGLINLNKITDIYKTYAK